MFTRLTRWLERGQSLLWVFASSSWKSLRRPTQLYFSISSLLSLEQLCACYLGTDSWLWIWSPTGQTKPHLHGPLAHPPTYLPDLPTHPLTWPIHLTYSPDLPTCPTSKTDRFILTVSPFLRCLQLQKTSWQSDSHNSRKPARQVIGAELLLVR